MLIYILELAASYMWKGDERTVRITRACATEQDAQELGDKFKHAIDTSGGVHSYCPKLELVGGPTVKAVEIA